MLYLCLYNEPLHQTSDPMQIDEKDTVKNHIKNWKNSTDLYWEWMKARYELEAMNRGNGWQVWCEKEPFDWDKLHPEPAPEPEPQLPEENPEESVTPENGEDNAE